MIVAIFLVFLYCIQDGFALISRNSATSMHAKLFSSISSSATALIRKGKLKEVQVLRKKMEDKQGQHPLSKYLSHRVNISPSPGVQFYEFLYTKKGTLKVLTEYNHKSKTGFILGLPSPEVLGGILRDCSQGVIVSMDKRSGGCTVDEFERFTTEQYKARKSLPGSVPVVWNDYIVDDLQISLAAAYGASAVVLNVDILSNPSTTPTSSSSSSSSSSSASSSSLADTQLSHLLSACDAASLGHLVLVKNLAEFRHAVDCGARVVCFHNLDEEELVQVYPIAAQYAEAHSAAIVPGVTAGAHPNTIDASEHGSALIHKPLSSSLSSSSSSSSAAVVVAAAAGGGSAGARKDILIGARLRPAGDFATYIEVDMAWTLRDVGYHFLWPSVEAVFATSINDVYTCLTAMRAKASREFYSPRQFFMERSREGAQEYLGDILY